jgi:hypothetical protein
MTQYRIRYDDGWSGSWIVEKKNKPFGWEYVLHTASKTPKECEELLRKEIERLKKEKENQKKLEEEIYYLEIE